MYRSKFIILLILVWFTAGCQHSSLKTTVVDNTQTPVNSADTPQVVIISDNETTDKVDVHEDLVSKNKDTNSDITNQHRIDQALELCNHAQQMWEKG